MQTLFHPRSVLVVGVSARPGNLAHAIVRNLIEFHYDGEVHLFGKRAECLYGHRILTEWADVPDGIDLAVILTPAATVPDVLDACGRKGIRWAVVESGGFGEFRAERRTLETALLDTARRHGMRVVGPNGLGIVQFHRGLAVPFMPLRKRMRPGGVALLAQSGGVGVYYMNSFAAANLGLHTFVSLGNKLDLNECDYLEYLRTQGVDLVCLYVEDIKQGRRFFEVTRDYPCPVLVQKAAVNQAGAKAAASHTASLAVDDAVVEATLRQNGLIRVHDMYTMLNAAKALTLPPMRGNRLMIVSRSGGHAVIAADFSQSAGLELPQPDETARERIRASFRAQVIDPRNPLDLGDLFDFDVYVRILEDALGSPDVDGVVFIHVYEPLHERAASRRLVAEAQRVVKQCGKPVYLCLLSDESELAEVRRTETFPIFDSPESALRAVAVSRDHWRRRSQPGLSAADLPAPADPATVAGILAAAQAAGQRLLTADALALLQAAGLPVAPFRVARSAADVARSAAEVGYPLAMKVLSPALPHKSDVGGVVLHIAGPEAATQTFAGLASVLAAAAPQAPFEGVLMQQMVRGAREVFVGARRDPHFGPLVLVGLGGVLVEVFRDIAMRLVPFTERDLTDMLDEVVSFKAFREVRGRPAADLDFLRHCVRVVARLLVDNPSIAEIDVNPLKLYDVGQGASIVDARVLLHIPTEG